MSRTRKHHAPQAPALAILSASMALVAGAACTQTSPQPNLAGQDVHLTVIHTADIHSRLFPYEFAPGQIDKSLGLTPSQGDIAVVGGAARMATVIQSIRASSDRAVHVDSGDIFEGAPVFNTFNGEVEMRAATLLGMNAMALGNHEFDKGPVNLELMKERFGGFPILAANYLFADPTDPTQPKLRDVIQPYTILNSGGLRIGVIGMGNLSSLEGIYEGNNALGVRPLDTLQSIKATVALLRPQVDLLIMTTHLGLDVDEALAQSNTMCQSTQICKTNVDCVSGSFCKLDPESGNTSGTCQYNVCDQNSQAAIKGVDVIFGGHLHIVLNPPNRIDHKKIVNGKEMPDGYTVVCHSGAFAKYVGRLDLVVHVADGQDHCGLDGPVCKTNADCAAMNEVCSPDEGHVKSYTYQLFPITDQTVPIGDADMERMLEPYQLQMDLHLNLGESYAVVPCPSTAGTCPKVTRTDANGGDSQLGNLVATSMRLRKRVEADFALTNSLGIRADFESGPLSLEEMFNVFPFDNTIATMFLSGHEIQEMLDFIASRAAERGCKSQAQVSGIWFVSDCTHQVSCGPFDATGKRATRCHASDRQLAPDAPHLDGPPLLGDDCINHPEKCAAVLPYGSYRVAVNDYIANGGSGFAVLKRNTTKYNTGISLRDSLLDYLRTLPDRCTDKNLYTNLTSPYTNHRKCKADQDCGGDGYVCDPDTNSVTYQQCTKIFDYRNLPCLIPDGSPGAQQGHDGRVSMVAP